MAHGLPVSMSGKVIGQTEVVCGVATKRLFKTPKPCGRVLVSAPSANHKRIGPNVGRILIGAGSVTVTLAAQPADGNTITLSDGVLSTVFEFDSNAAVGGGNVPVAIGATATDTINNLIAAILINSRANNSPTTAEKDAGGDIANLLYVESIAKVGANITLGAINEKGSTPLEVDNLIGVFEASEDASLVYVTGFNANDAVEVRVYV